MRDALRWLRKYWFLVTVLGGGAAWGADHYIDDRIESKLAAVVEKLEAISHDLAIIKDRLGIPPTP